MKHNSNYVYLAIGSNLKLLPYSNISKLHDNIKLRLPKIGLRVIKYSSIWKTYPIPYSNIPLFVNSVVKCSIINKNINEPQYLLKQIKALEKKIGRKKSKFSISRAIDIDIIDYKGLVFNDKLILPHPRLHLRKFVLYPMQMIARNWKHPIYKKDIKFLAAKIKTKQHLRKKL